MTVPPTLPSKPSGSVLTESMLLAGRMIKRWRLEPLLPLQSLLFPTLLLIVYFLLAGESIRRIAGTDNLAGMVPMCALAGGMFGALGAGFGIPAERRTGLLSRLWAFPVHRASLLLGRLMAEGVRALIGSVLITLVGVGLGLRFQGGWVMVIPYLLVTVLVVVVFAMVIITLALGVGPDGNTLFTWLGAGMIGLVFGSSGVAPVHMYPSWIRPVIQYQPLSPPIELMRGLIEGGPLLWPFVWTMVWMTAIAAVFYPLAIRNHRIASETS
ncbi:ABC transporter permease [Mycolicibacterium phlei]|uniref:ABC transporter permease n=1 Tax=Mycolicibacterium phlei TaxID=1771 RepID=UPI00025ADFE6|nr:ABC transporter permease [Mycolicibacterium phlei]EID18251.1 ABC transporter [Mycolicibacterium phlei RIVM601174]MBF4191315.1 ABC transporter [Mycolicibacterium phlei]